MLVHPVAEAHQPERVVPILGPTDELGIRSTEPISASMLTTASLAPPCAAPQGSDARRDRGVRLAPVEPTRRTVEVEAFCSWSACRMKMRSSARARTGLTRYLARHAEHHVQEVLGVIQVVARIHERLADRVLVGHRRDGRHLGEQPVAGDHPVVRVVDVEVLVIEGRQGADHRDHHRHRMRVRRKPRNRYMICSCSMV